MAPEQADPSFGEIGPATDVYALGVTAYEMLTGRVPFQGSAYVYGAQVNLQPPDPRDFCPTMSAEVAEVLLTCLKKSPSERFGSAEGMIVALRAAIGFTTPLPLGVAVDLPEMVPITAGSFWIGGADGDPEAQPNEKPRHEISTWAYEISKYPVTNQQYQAFVQTSGCVLPLHWVDGGPPPGQEDHPWCG
jgi:formylglycine-generating enzyme required for sulfatase activity